MKWHFTADSPIYTQLMEQLQVGMVTGMFPPGSRLPSVRDLAQEAGVNPNTIQRALTELERLNLVQSQRTSGRFVTQNDQLLARLRLDLAQGHVDHFWHEMVALGYTREEIMMLLGQVPREESQHGSSDL